MICTAVCFSAIVYLGNTNVVGIPRVATFCVVKNVNGKLCASASDHENYSVVGLKPEK